MGMDAFKHFGNTLVLRLQVLRLSAIYPSPVLLGSTDSKWFLRSQLTSTDQSIWLVFKRLNLLNEVSNTGAWAIKHSTYILGSGIPQVSELDWSIKQTQVFNTMAHVAG